MRRIIVTKIFPTSNMVTIGFFPKDGGESTQTLTLHKSLFPEDIKEGVEVVFIEKSVALAITK